MTTTRFTRIVTGAAGLALTAGLALAGPASATSTWGAPQQSTTTSSPTGTTNGTYQPPSTATQKPWSPGRAWYSGTDDEYCVHMTNNANDLTLQSWGAYQKGDIATAKQLASAADQQAGTANMNGCNVYQAE